MNRKIGKRGLLLLKGDGRCRLVAYDDATGKVAAPGCIVKGKVTIGWGHTGPDVVSGMEIDQQTADEMLLKDIAFAEHIVNGVKTELNQNQFDAVVSFVFNVGAGNFQGSTMLKLLNAGDLRNALLEFPHWTRSGGVVVEGLKKWRGDEMRLFIMPEDKTDGKISE